MNIVDVYRILEWWRSKGGSALVLGDELVFWYNDEESIIEFRYDLSDKSLKIFWAQPNELDKALRKLEGTIDEEKFESILHLIFKAAKMFSL